MGLQLNLSTMATFGTEESGHCRKVLSKSQCMDFFVLGTKEIVAVVERWLLVEVRLNNVLLKTLLIHSARPQIIKL